MRFTTIFLIILTTEAWGGRPRVYNALISTNQELLPSRAYPAVSPVIGQPVYVTSSVEIHHKEQHAVGTQQQYPDTPFEYQGQDIDQVNYDNYDDQQFQGYEKEGKTQQEVVPLPDNSRSGGHLSQELVRSSQESARGTHEVVRHSVRPPALQEAGRRPFHQPRHHPPQEVQWEDEPAPPKRPVQRPAPDARSRPTNAPEPQPSPRPVRPGKPPLISEFQLVGGIPLNNQPGNIPVVPPPPIPIRLT